jgi:hypothetical protein
LTLMCFEPENFDAVICCAYLADNEHPIGIIENVGDGVRIFETKTCLAFCGCPTVSSVF